MKRIFGTEVEYTFNPPPRLDGVPIESISILPQKAAKDFLWSTMRGIAVSNNTYLLNGGRFYLDGRLPEYATAEFARIRGLIAQEKAGEEVMAVLADIVREEFRYQPDIRWPFGDDRQLLKRNSDAWGRPVGTHENYLVSRQLPLALLAEALSPFLVTRQIVAGGGVVHWTDGIPQLALSERAAQVTSGLAIGTTQGALPLVLLRDRPYANDTRFRRLQIIGGDSTRSETTMLLKVGATDLLLQAIAAGCDFEDLRLHEQARDTPRVSVEGAQAVLRMRHGGEMTALEVQEQYFLRVSAFAQRTGLDADPDVQLVLELWGRVLFAVATGQLHLIDRDIDWAIKARVLADDGLRSALCDSAADVMAPGQTPEHVIDAMYAVVGENSLYALLNRKHLVNHVVTHDEISAAKTTPPNDTRAKVRAKAVALKDNGVVVDAWDQLRYDGIEPSETAHMSNPRKSKSKQAMALISRAIEGGPVTPRLAASDYVYGDGVPVAPQVSPSLVRATPRPSATTR